MKLTILVLSLVLVANVQADTQVAITIDDLPRHGPILKDESRVQLARRLIDAFKSAQLPEVYGFVNGKKLEDHPEEIEVLKLWKAAGQPLGNHTYSHPNLAKMPADQFIKDIEKNESVLRTVERPHVFKWFRYPFLIEGETLEKRETVRKSLTEMGYQIAQVTIDFEDWAWYEPYVRCSQKGDRASVDWLKSSYLEHALNRLKFATTAANLVFGRPIRHVLLLHIGTFDSIMFPELIKNFKENGVKFVSLSEAMADSVYGPDPKIVMSHGDPFLDQLIWQKKLPYPAVPKLPFERLKAICN